MKTIKEKAEEYDRLKALVMKCATDKYGCIIGIKPSDMFSELAESEDEKFLRYIIDCCKETIEAGDKGLELSMGTTKRLLALFEKQKGTKREDEGNSLLQSEQKPTELSNTCEFSMKTWVNIVDFVLTEHNGIGNYLDDPEVKDTAQKLQKKYKFDAASEEWDRVYRKGLDAGVNKGRAEALREQKPAWSEEDERIYQSIMDDTVQENQLDDKQINWLKFLKEKVQPQNAWKPSKEQIIALRWVLNNVPYNKHKEEISGLLDQIKDFV